MKKNIPIISAVAFCLAALSTSSVALPPPGEKRALAACLANAKQEMKLGNYDRISRNYGMNKPARSVYEYYFNIAVNDKTGAGSERALMKVYCRATSGKRVQALRFSGGSWVFIEDKESSVMRERIADVR